MRKCSYCNRPGKDYRVLKQQYVGFDDFFYIELLCQSHINVWRTDTRWEAQNIML